MSAGTFIFSNACYSFVEIGRFWNLVWTMRTLNMRTMRTLIKVRKINAINVNKLLGGPFKISSFFFSFRFNFARQGRGSSSRWNGSESSFFPAFWLHDLPRLHPTQPLWRSVAWSHSAGRPATPPAGQPCWSIYVKSCFGQEKIKVCPGQDWSALGLVFSGYVFYVASNVVLHLLNSPMPERRICLAVLRRACTLPPSWQTKAWLRQVWTGTAWR